MPNSRYPGYLFAHQFQAGRPRLLDRLGSFINHDHQESFNPERQTKPTNGRKLLVIFSSICMLEIARKWTEVNQPSGTIPYGVVWSVWSETFWTSLPWTPTSPSRSTRAFSRLRVSETCCVSCTWRLPRAIFSRTTGCFSTVTCSSRT